MSASQLVPWLTIGAALIAAGLYIGRLEGRIAVVEAQQHYIHGSFSIPKE